MHINILIAVKNDLILTKFTMQSTMCVEVLKERINQFILSGFKFQVGAIHFKNITDQMYQSKTSEHNFTQQTLRN